MAQSYVNNGGSGNRTSSITVTTTATVTGSASVLVDGAQGDSFWFGNGQSGREVKFDLGVPRLITEAKWYQDTSASHGTWQWQGSPDNSAWTNIGSTFTLGGVVTQTITTLSGNATFYRYYRMLQTAGTTASNPYLREIEFSIDDTVVLITNAVVTQAAVEEWFAPSPDAQVTQAAIEQWQQLWPDAQITQIALEHWLRANPDAQITQVLLEHWAQLDPPLFWATQVAIEHWGAGSAVVRLALTQAAIEHWASTDEAPLPAIGPMITTIF